MQFTSSAKEVPLLSEHHAHGGSNCSPQNRAKASSQGRQEAEPQPCTSTFLGRWGGHGCPLISGGEVRALGGARQGPSRSFLHQVICSTGRTKQKGPSVQKKEKDITFPLNVSFSLPRLGSPLMQIQGNSISHTAADLGFLTTVEEL